jgi:hypothetical protein
MSDPDCPQRGVEGDPGNATVAPDATDGLVGDAAASLHAPVVARATQSCIAPTAHPSADDHPEGHELVRLAEDLQAAIESDDIRLAREAHGALGKQLERADGNERVVDLARARARRRRAR